MSRSLYTPSAFRIVQTKDYVVILLERTPWRLIPLDGRPHLWDEMHLWQGDSFGHWDSDVIVVETTNFNHKTWLSTLVHKFGNLFWYAATRGAGLPSSSCR